MFGRLCFCLERVLSEGYQARGGGGSGAGMSDSGARCALPTFSARGAIDAATVNWVFGENTMEQPINAWQQLDCAGISQGASSLVLVNEECGAGACAKSAPC